MARKLRIAVSVFFGVVTVALVVLWVRSHREYEILTRISSTGRLVTLGLNNGTIYFVTMKRKIAPPRSATAPRRSGWSWRSHDWKYSTGTPNTTSTPATWQLGSDSAFIVTPIWLLVVFTAVGGCGSWLPWRFSLRTLLIATTLFAVVLGLAVWAGR